MHAKRAAAKAANREGGSWRVCEAWGAPRFVLSLKGPGRLRGAASRGVPGPHAPDPVLFPDPTPRVSGWDTGKSPGTRCGASPSRAGVFGQEAEPPRAPDLLPGRRGAPGALRPAVSVVLASCSPQALLFLELGTVCSPGGRGGSSLSSQKGKK